MSIISVLPEPPMRKNYPNKGKNLKELPGYFMTTPIMVSAKMAVTTTCIFYHIWNTPDRLKNLTIYSKTLLTMQTNLRAQKILHGGRNRKNLNFTQHLNAIFQSMFCIAKIIRIRP